jgi:integrase
VSGRLGHANAATTLNVYAHVLEASDRDAAGVIGGLLAGPTRRGTPADADRDP